MKVGSILGLACLALCPTVLLLQLAGCGSGEGPIGRETRRPKKATGGEGHATGPEVKDPKEGKKKPAAEQTTPYQKDKATAKLTGKALLPGKEPKEGKKIDVSSNPDCAKLHAEDKPLRYEFEILGAGGALANVIVYVSEGWEKYSYDVPDRMAEILQTGCHYEPHVQAMMAGQKLKVRNNDPTLHNVNSGGANFFNISQAQQGREDIKPINVPEMPMRLKCDVHQWMGAYIGVFEHPFYAVTKADGTFEIPNLPAGAYTLTAWHETNGETTQKVTLGDGETKNVDFTFGKK